MTMRDYKAEQRAFQDLHQEQRKELTRQKQNMVVEDGNMIDTETGELLNDKFEINEVVSGDTVEKRKKGKAVKEEVQKHSEENGGFVFAFYETCKQISEQYPDFNQADLASLMFVGVHVSFGTNHLTHPNGKKIDKKALKGLLGMSRNKFTQFYRKLISNEILTETETGLVMNANMFFRGFEQDIPKSAAELQHTRMYRQTIKDLYGMFDQRSMKKLGLIYAVLPYVNYRVNIVCNNPTNNNEDELNAMTIGELADTLGYEDTTKLAKNLKEIKHNGQSVFKLVEDDNDSRSKYVIVNPNVVYAGNGEALKSLQILFR